MKQDPLDRLLTNPGVRAEVKKILKREYPHEEPAYSVFVEHSNAVAELACSISDRVGGRTDFVLEAAWLHDVGMKYTRAPGIGCLGEEPYLKHGIIGREICEREGLREHGLVCERHVGTGLTAAEIREQQLPLPCREMLCQTLEERIVCYADQFFSKSTPDTLTVEEVRKRVGRHGNETLRRFESMHLEFGSAAGSARESA
jgi:uncharacterized protein